MVCLPVKIKPPEVSTVSEEPETVRPKPETSGVAAANKARSEEKDRKRIMAKRRSNWRLDCGELLLPQLYIVLRNWLNSPPGGIRSIGISFVKEARKNGWTRTR
jgi:hypothetical protein